MDKKTSKIFFDIAISPGGYMAGDNRGPQNPIGDGGKSLHNWMYTQKAFLNMQGEKGGEDGSDNKLIDESLARTGSYIMGKRMFEEGEPNWPEDLYKTDVYVLTHEKREPWVQKGTTVFYFLNDGIEGALAKAKKSAKEKDIRIQGGVNIIQQFLNAGLVDDFIIHLTPVVLGSGIRLFDTIDKTKYEIEISEVIPSKLTTHIKYKLTKKQEE
ncbi:MAG: dihydrofolate reductase family protein [Ferruginibacter sp.]